MGCRAAPSSVLFCLKSSCRPQCRLLGSTLGLGHKTVGKLGKGVTNQVIDDGDVEGTAWTVCYLLTSCKFLLQAQQPGIITDLQKSLYEDRFSLFLRRVLWQNCGESCAARSSTPPSGYKGSLTIVIWNRSPQGHWKTKACKSSLQSISSMSISSYDIATPLWLI